MPLDTTLYPLTSLRPDGRRWNELRHLTGTLSPQPAASGSSSLTLGLTSVLCTVSGPLEASRLLPTTTNPPQPSSRDNNNNNPNASISVAVLIAPFATAERQKRGRGDKRVAELQATLRDAFAEVVLRGVYPHSSIHVALTVLSLDGGLLAACINAATLALVDAGVPMAEYLVACTAGSCPTSFAAAPPPPPLPTGSTTMTTTTTTTTTGSREVVDAATPFLDLSGQEELEIPFLTVATLGAGEKVVVLVMETRVGVERVEGMLAAGVDGCGQVRGILDGVVRGAGRRMLRA